MKIIKAADLRVGNYIQTDYEGLLEVVNINNEGFDFVDCRKPTYRALGRYEIEPQIKPIPLTEEWLLKIGGKPLTNGYWISVSNLKAELHFELFKNTDEIVTTLKSQFCDLILDRIYYVHQLQNLYFALTNEELTPTL